MTAPKLSVVMTVLNGAQYLPSALHSVLTQTFADFEFIVVDDGSVDNTWAILGEFAVTDSRMRLVRNEKNLGITRSLNAIWPLLRGEYVNRHDADDISVPDRYAQQVEFLDTHPAVGLVSCLISVIDQAGQLLDRDPYASLLDNDSIQSLLLDHNCLCQGSVIFRRACLERVGYYDEALELTEDYDLWLRMAEITQVAKLPTPLYQYRHHEASVSHARRAEQDLHQAQTLEKTLKRRWGIKASRQQLRRVVQNYIAAVESSCLANDRTLARQSLVQALRLYPDYFASREGYLPLQLGSTIPDFLDEVFSDLPVSPVFRSLRSKMLGRWHLTTVFSAVAQNRADLIENHLWAGLREDPSWLANRGVLALTIKSLVKATKLTAGLNERKDKFS